MASLSDWFTAYALEPSLEIVTLGSRGRRLILMGGQTWLLTNMQQQRQI